MKRISIAIMISTFLLKISFTQTFTDVTPLNFPNVNYGSVDLGDYDNDDDLDILFNGTDDSNNYITSVYKNNGSFSFSKLENTDFIGATSGSSEWGDYNNDGLLDFYVFGWVSEDNYIMNIYKNEGSDNFTLVETSQMEGTRLGDANWGDLDNDGDLDIFITGLFITTQGYFSSSPRLFENIGNDIFKKVEGNYFISVTNSAVDLGDYDNDSDIDILYTGWTGSDTYGSVAKLYRNEGGFIFIEDTTFNLEGMHRGNIEFGDYDQDSDLDILIVGNRRINGSNLPSAKIYDNNQGEFTENLNADLWVVDDGTARWGDFENDGDLDVVLTSGAYSSRHTYIYINNGDNTFTERKEEKTGLIGFDYSDLSWGDLDNDHDLDLLIIGQYNATTKLYRNDSAEVNTSPISPSNLNSIVKVDTVMLDWDNGVDNETSEEGLSYNICIWNKDGFVIAPMSDTTTGKRKIVGIGNCNLNKSWKSSTLRAGEYYWKVQTIDNSFEGSSFSVSDTFNIPISSTFQLKKNIFCENEEVRVAYIGNASQEALFSWDFDGADILSDSTFGITNISWSENGQKEIQLFINHGEQHSDTTKIIVYVNPAPKANFYGDTTIIEGRTANLFSDFEGTPPFTLTYGNGYMSNTISSDSNSTKIKIYAANTYKISELIDGNNCSSGQLNDSIVVLQVQNNDTVNNSNNIELSELKKTWQYGSLGHDLGEAGILIYDLDGNGVNEIISTGRYAKESWNESYFFTILEYSEIENNYITKWISNIIDGEIKSISLQDTDNNGTVELLLYLSNNTTKVFDTKTFKELNATIQTGTIKSTNNLPPNDATNYAYGDLDADDEVELIFSEGANCTCADYFFIYDSITNSKEWQSVHFTGDFKAFDIGDINNDQENEIVSGVFGEFLKYYDHGFLSVYDAKTKNLKYRNSEEIFGAHVNDFTSIHIGDVNNDSINEILLGIDYGYSSSSVYVFDTNYNIIKTYNIDGMDIILGIDVADIDLDKQNELVVTSGTNVGGSTHPEEWQNYIYIFDSETGTLEHKTKQLGNIGSKIGSLNIGNIDSDSALEVVALNYGSYSKNGELIIIDGISKELFLDTRNNYSAVTLGDIDNDNQFELIAAVDTGKVLIINGQLLDIIEGYDVRCEIINAIQSFDINNDLDLELVILDKHKVVLYDLGKSKIFGQSDKINSNIGAYNSVKVGDYDLDGKYEIFLNGNHALFCYEIDADSTLTSVPENIVNAFKSDKINVFPNPFKESLNLIINAEVNKEVDVSIYDVNGRMIQKKHYYLEYGTNNISLKTQSYDEGIYMIIVHKNSQIFGISKVLKQ